MASEAQLELACRAYIQSYNDWRVYQAGMSWLVEPRILSAAPVGSVPIDEVAYHRFDTRDEAIAFVRRKAMRAALQFAGL